MKSVGILITLLALSSCGKEVKDSKDNKVVSITPGLTEEIIDDTIDANDKFTASVSKTNFDSNEVIIIKIENTGEQALNHLGFEFFGAPSMVNVTRINCFETLEVGASCSFAAVYTVVQEGDQSIKVTYDNYGFESSSTIHYVVNDTIEAGVLILLKDGIHSKEDCEKEIFRQKSGVVETHAGEKLCSFRGENYYETETTPISENPLEVFNSGTQNVDDYYCPESWKLGSFEFSPSIVKEKKNFFGGERDVVIPAGESREVCVKHGLFSCSEKKVFYSRLSKVKCY